MCFFFLEEAAGADEAGVVTGPAVDGEGGGGVGEVPVAMEGDGGGGGVVMGGREEPVEVREDVAESESVVREREVVDVAAPPPLVAIKDVKVALRRVDCVKVLVEVSAIVVKAATTWDADADVAEAAMEDAIMASEVVELSTAALAIEASRTVEVSLVATADETDVELPTTFL